VVVITLLVEGSNANSNILIGRGRGMGNGGVCGYVDTSLI
jgi:hypothetical protein